MLLILSFDSKEDVVEVSETEDFETFESNPSSVSIASSLKQNTTYYFRAKIVGGDFYSVNSTTTLFVPIPSYLLFIVGFDFICFWL